MSLHSSVIIVMKLTPRLLDERAWCAGLLGSSREAGTLFLTVAKNSSWSPSFYGYLGACYYYEQAFKVLCLMPDDLKELSRELSARNEKRSVQDEARLLLSKALAWFKTVPNLGKKRSSFPPERFAIMRCADVNLLTAKHATLTSRGGAANGTTSNSAQVSLDTVPEDKIRVLSSALFWPTTELAYFWNGLFQIENKAQVRRELEQSMAVYRKYQMDEDPVKKHNFLCMYRLFRGAMLREERQFADADAELAQLVPSIDFSIQVGVNESGANVEKWTVEFAKYERGLCQWELGDRKQALAWWNAVKDSGHPLDARLKFRLKSALRKAAGGL